MLKVMKQKLMDQYLLILINQEKQNQQNLLQFLFKAGNLIRLNNVYGGASVGIATTGYVDLRSDRLSTDRDEPAGQSIGRARVYDFKLSAGGYSNATSSFDLFLFDIQTDTEITLN